MSHVFGIAAPDVIVRGMNSPQGFAYGVDERVEISHNGILKLLCIYFGLLFCIYVCVRVCAWMCVCVCVCVCI